MKVTDGGWTWEAQHARWLLQYRVDGRPMKARGATKADALAKRDARVFALGGELPAGSSVLSLSRSLHAYLTSAGRVRPATLKNYRAAWARLIDELGDCPLDAVTGEQLERILSAMAQDGAAESTMRAWRKSVHPVFAWATVHGKIPTNPWAQVRRLDKFRAVKRDAPEPLERDDAATLSKYLRAELSGPHVALLLMLHAGLRIGEALGLRWADIGPGMIRVRQQADGAPLKTDSSRRDVTAVPSFLFDVLDDWRAQCPNDAVLVCTPTATARRALTDSLARRGVQEALRLACERAGVRRIHCHGLRHTAGSELYRVTGDLTLVAGFLGHGSLVLVTTLYVKSTGRTDARALLDAELF